MKSLRKPQPTSSQSKTSPTTKKSSRSSFLSFTEHQKSTKLSTMPCLKTKTGVATIVWFCTLICIIPKFRPLTALRLRKCFKVSLPRQLKNSEIFPTEELWVWVGSRLLRSFLSWSENSQKLLKMTQSRLKCQANYFKSCIFTQSSPRSQTFSVSWLNWSKPLKTITFCTTNFTRLSNQCLRSHTKTSQLSKSCYLTMKMCW